MLIVRKSIGVDVPVDKVFSYLADITRHPEWVHDMVQSTKTSSGPVRVGSTFAITTYEWRPSGGASGGSFKNKVTADVLVTEFLPNQRLVFESMTQEYGTGRFRHRFEVRSREDGSTLVTRSKERVFELLLAKLFIYPFLLIWTRLIWPFLALGSARDLRRLKQRVKVVRLSTRPAPPTGKDGESHSASRELGGGLERFQGVSASTSGDRLSLYESGLRALLEARDGFIVFGRKDTDERFVQFAADSPSAGLTGEVGSRGVSDEMDEMLHDLGFRPPDNSNPNYYRVFDEVDARALAEQVEKIFIDTLGCPDTYIAEVVASESH